MSNLVFVDLTFSFVENVEENSSGFRAGFLKNDFIARIGDKSCINETLDRVVALLKVLPFIILCEFHISDNFRPS